MTQATFICERFQKEMPEIFNDGEGAMERLLKVLKILKIVGYTEDVRLFLISSRWKEPSYIPLDFNLRSRFSLQRGGIDG